MEYNELVNDNQAMPWLDGGFEKTPEGFSTKMRVQLHHLSTKKEATRKKMRLVSIVAVLILLLGATAYAASQLGVFYFLTERTTTPITAQEMAENAIAPIAQKAEGGLLKAELRDGVIMNETLSLCLHVAPEDMEKYAAIYGNSIGTDGENSDWVWMDGKIYKSLSEWVPDGKTPLVVDFLAAKLGGFGLIDSWDYVYEDSGITFLVELDLSTFSIIHDISIEDLGDTAEIRFEAQSFVNNEGEGEATVLTATISVKTSKEGE